MKTIRLLWLCAITLILFTRCTTTRYLPYEVVRQHTEKVAVSDTLIIRDSIFVDKQGDTIRESRDRIIYRTLHSTDTVVHCDTIREPYAVEVPTPLTHWEKAKIDYGGYAIMIVIFALITILVIVALKLKRH